MRLLLINDELFSIEDQSRVLVQTLLTSDLVADYHTKKQALNAQDQVQQLRQIFGRKKEEVADLGHYGKYAPGLKEKQLALQKLKRQLDFEPTVAEFKVAEMDVQEKLDTIVSSLARVISCDIKVDTGNPFFEGKQTHDHHHGCQGGCHHG